MKYNPQMHDLLAGRCRVFYYYFVAGIKNAGLVKLKMMKSC